MCGRWALSGRRAHVTDVYDFIRVCDATAPSEILQRLARCCFAISDVSREASSVTSKAPVVRGKDVSVVVPDVICTSANVGNVSSGRMVFARTGPRTSLLTETTGASLDVIVDLER